MYEMAANDTKKERHMSFFWLENQCNKKKAIENLLAMKHLSSIVIRRKQMFTLKSEQH